MGFGCGFKHEDSAEMLEEGNYTAKIVKAEIKNGSYGDYIQAEVEDMMHSLIQTDTTYSQMES